LKDTGKRTKRLIETILPIKEISLQSRKEKSMRHGHISTLHIWWARRPLAACRAVIFASLIPDPGNEKERQELVELTAKLAHRRVGFDDEHDEVLEQARALIREHYGDEAPKVLDPFAGGGAIPLEALRLGCEAYAVELNPVAHIIELCTLVYPQKYNLRIKLRDALAKYGLEPEGNGRNETGKMFADADLDEEVSELAFDVRYWGNVILERVKKKIGHLYPKVNGKTPIAYLWARTVRCPNPACGATIPLIRQTWLCKKEKKKVAYRVIPDEKTKRCRFEIVKGDDIDFDPSEGTMRRDSTSCPFCGYAVPGKQLRHIGKSEGLGEQPICIVVQGAKGKDYVPIDECSNEAFEEAQTMLEELKQDDEWAEFIPTEPVIEWSGVFNAPLYGLDRFDKLFNPRQLLALLHFTKAVRDAYPEIEESAADPEYAKAVAAYVSLVITRLSDYFSVLSAWENTQERVAHVFKFNALPMVWDYGEIDPTVVCVGSFASMLRSVHRVLEAITAQRDCLLIEGHIALGSAAALSLSDAEVDTIVTDPPYYDAVPYADLSDFFYVWLKRTIGHLYPDVFSTPLTPKKEEIVQHNLRSKSRVEGKAFYVQEMTKAFKEAHRVLKDDGIFVVVFAHKTTEAWETIIRSLLDADLVVDASWPIVTEQAERLRAHGSAALASSVWLVCRKRAAEAGIGYSDAVAPKIAEEVRSRLDTYWDAGIRGADFFVSAIGPAIKVFGQYSEVRDLSGEPVSPAALLDIVRDEVVKYIVGRIYAGVEGEQLDPETKIYIAWRWLYGPTELVADEAMKLSRSFGAEFDELKKQGIYLQKKQNAACPEADERLELNEKLGERFADGRRAPLIDAVHRAEIMWDEGAGAPAIKQFLDEAGYLNDGLFWKTAQALAELKIKAEAAKDKNGNGPSMVSDAEARRLAGLLNDMERIRSAKVEGLLFEA